MLTSGIGKMGWCLQMKLVGIVVCYGLQPGLIFHVMGRPQQCVSNQWRKSTNDLHTFMDQWISTAIILQTRITSMTLVTDQTKLLKSSIDCNNREVSVHVSHLDFVSQNMCHLREFAFIIVFFWQAWPIETPCYTAFSSFCLQMTNNFLSTCISSTTPVKAIPLEMFLILDKKTNKSVQNSIRFSTTQMNSCDRC